MLATRGCGAAGDPNPSKAVLGGKSEFEVVFGGKELDAGNGEALGDVENEIPAAGCVGGTWNLDDSVGVC